MTRAAIRDNSRTVIAAALIPVVAPILYLISVWLWGSSTSTIERAGEALSSASAALILLSIPVGIFAVWRARGAWRAVGVVGLAATATLIAWFVWFATGS